MQNSGWYKGRSGNSCCVSRHVRNAGVHREIHDAENPERAHSLFDFPMRPCCQPSRGGAGTSCPNPAPLGCSHRRYLQQHPWGLAVLKTCDRKQRVWQERKKWCRMVHIPRNPAEQYLFPWKKSYLHGEFTCINDCGRIFLRKPLVNILAAWEWFFFPVTNVAPSATKPLVPRVCPSPLKGHHRNTLFAGGMSGGEGSMNVPPAAVACPHGEELAMRKQASWGWLPIY